MAKVQTKEPRKPKTGEQTKRQIPVSNVAGMVSTMTGFGQAPRGSYKTYRQMRANPTVALARAVAFAPIRTASWSIVADDDVPDDYVEFIEKQVKSFWPSFIKSVLFSLDYGWMPFEKVWAVVENRLVYEKIKPLLVDKTIPMVDKDTGRDAGLRQLDVNLPPENCFTYTYDKEFDNIFGRPRHENIRTSAWNQWQEISENRGKYAKKTSGIIPMVEYPEGTGRDAAGIEKPNFELAKNVLENLGRGNGVAMPNTMAAFAGDLARSGIDISKLKAWHISFLEGKGNHARGYSDTLRHLESLLMRGWLVPERTATEGQFGTKAESETQSEIALIIADLDFLDIIAETNIGLINPLVIYNFGSRYKDKIRLERGGIDPILRAFFKEIIKSILGEKSNIDLFLNWIDVNSLIDSVGLPKAQEKITTDETKAKAVEKKEKDDIEESKSGKLERFVRSVFRRPPK